MTAPAPKAPVVALKPCPFCGGSAEWREGQGPRHPDEPWGLIVNHADDCFLSLLTDWEETCRVWNIRAECEALYGPGVSSIAAERARQIAEEGWTPVHDDEHDAGQFCAAAACYALSGYFDTPEELKRTFARYWPWNREWWKPKDRLRNLERAGALIAAEIDRIKRQGPTASDEASLPLAAIDQLRNHQKQSDADGAMVTVSRQAIDEVLRYIDMIGGRA